jgi:cation:H+ antiporter
LVWFKFILCIGIILFAGTKTTRYADIIADKTGLGRIWIGMLLLGIITSMPELITSLSSVTLVGGGVPDLGMGTLLGSCIFNLSVLAILDIMNRRVPVLNYASRRHISSALIGILLFAILAVAISFSEGLSGLMLGWLGVPCLTLFIIYLLGAWGVYTSERNYQLSLMPVSEEADETPGEAPIIKPEIKWLWPKFITGALAIIGTGIWLSFVGNEIAEVTNWDTSFVGSLFLAISTSMPELVVAISAFHIGAIDLAVADILGANMLDVTYIFILDILYTKGPILSSVSGVHTISAIIAAVMSLAVIIGLRFQQKRKTFIFISWYGILLIGLYLFGAYHLFIST